MLSGDALKVLKKLNPRLDVYCGNNPNSKAGVWYLGKDGEYNHLYAIEKNEVPRYSISDKKGHLLIAGMNRIIRSLLKSKLTTLELVKKHYAQGFEFWNNDHIIVGGQEELLSQIKNVAERSHETGDMDRAEVEYLADQVDNTMTSWEKEKQEKRRAEFKKQLGLSSDKSYISITR